MQKLPGKLTGSQGAHARLPSGLLHRLVRTDHHHFLRICDPLQALLDQMVSRLTLPRKLDGHPTLFFGFGQMIPHPGVKNNGKAMSGAGAVATQIINQLGFIVRIVQPQAGHLADEIMSVNKPLHNLL